MVFVIVKNNGVVVAKEAYGGDTSKLSGKLAERASLNKALSFDVYDELTESVFDAIEVVSKPNSEQIAWTGAKTKDIQGVLTIIGKKLGLE